METGIKSPTKNQFKLLDKLDPNRSIHSWVNIINAEEAYVYLQFYLVDKQERRLIMRQNDKILCGQANDISLTFTHLNLLNSW